MQQARVVASEGVRASDAPVGDRTLRDVGGENPAEHVRVHLSAARQRGDSFAEARGEAMAAVLELPDLTERQGKGRCPLLSTSNLYRTGGLAASPGSCRIIAGRKPEPGESGRSEMRVLSSTNPDGVWS